MIERIVIKNFKSIRELDLELKPINILIGANGAGKSNFISFLKMNRRIYEHRFQDYIEGNIDKFLHFGRKNSQSIYGLVEFSNLVKSPINYAIYFWIKPEEYRGILDLINVCYLNKSELPNHLTDTYSDIKDIPHLNWFHAYEGIRKSEFSDIGMSTIHKENINAFLSSLSIFHFHDTGSSSPMKRINNIDDNDYLREDGANLAAYLYYIQEKHPKEFKKIELQIRSVAPFFDRFNLAPRKLNPNEIILRWFEKGYDSYFDAFDLSDGTLRYMALTTLLMQPNLPKVIIIDEPELGLHPFAINKLAALIRQVAKKGTQVIVATQSVNFVDNFEPEDIIAVDREDNQSAFKRLNSEELKEWLEDYTLGELWRKNLLGAMP